MFSLDIIFSLSAFTNGYDAWRLIEEPFRNSFDKVVDGYSGKKMSVQDYSMALNASGEKFFNVEVNQGKMRARYFHVSTRSTRFQRMLLQDIVVDINDASIWLKKILDEPSFVQARIYNKHYDNWQNTQSISSYETANKPYDHLPVISNGLPAPLEEDILDISGNPGRALFKFGYMESVGATMWLGNSLWEFSGASKDKVLTSTLFEVEAFEKYIKVRAGDSPFTGSDGEEGECQHKMRALVFGKA